MFYQRVQRNFHLFIARDIKVDIPFEIDAMSEKKTFTYLDTTGRPTVVVKKKNVVSDLGQPILVSAFSQTRLHILMNLGVISKSLWQLDLLCS